VSFFSPEVKDIKIETVREIQRRMGLKLAEGRWRVFVLDGADFLNPSSANCLLKVLEEPSPQSLLVLLSENPRHLLPTILSRTQSVRFRPVPAPVIRTWLSGNGFSDTEADELSRLSQGRMSRIEALRDPERQKQRQKAMKAARDLPQWTPGTALRNAERLAQEARKAGRESLVDFLEELLFWQRDLLWIKTGGEEDGLTYFSEREQLAEQAVPLTLEQVRQRVEWIMEAIGMVRANVYAEMALAVTFLRLSGRMPAGSL
jgi:DNA polymerase-3 subunit delta'